MPGRIVLQQADIARALTRISHEILESGAGPAKQRSAEQHSAEQYRDEQLDDLVLLGIPRRGVVLADRIGAIIREISGTQVDVGALDVTMYRDDLSRNPTRAPSPTNLPAGGIDGRTIVLVDDVLYSGRTIRAALDALSGLGRPRVVRLATLIDRGHRELPIRPDFVGKNLPSAAGERIFVRLNEVDGEESVSIDGPV